MAKLEEKKEPQSWFNKILSSFTLSNHCPFGGFLQKCKLSDKSENSCLIKCCVICKSTTMCYCSKRIVLLQLNMYRYISINMPKYGNIEYDSKTDYWYIKLPEKWQKNRRTIVKKCHNDYKNEMWCNNAINKAIEWNEMFKMDSKDNIKWVSPPSMAGLHISLGTSIQVKNNDTKLKIGAKIDFNIKDIISFPTVYRIPKNLPGQVTDKYGYRYYPTHWIFIDIEFIDFKFKTKYTPHISLASIATKLNVNNVDKYQYT